MHGAAWIKARGRALGFDRVGIARVPGPGEPFPEGERFREWLARGHGGTMRYLERSQAARVDPARLVPDARSVVVVSRRHPRDPPEPAPGEGRVARYAWGRDYHNVLLTPLRKLRRAILERWPGTGTYARVDTGAVLEKAWAARAGLGWIGKNTMLLGAEDGSYTLLGVLLLALELEPDPQAPDRCGECRLCLDSCPTGAFPEPYVLDARRCISYLSIEDPGVVPGGLREAMGDRVFGCDACQEVCPYNLRPLRLRATAAEPPSPPLPTAPLHEPLEALLALDGESFRERMRGRPLLRPRREGLVRNACVAAGNSGDRRHVPRLGALLADPAPVVRAQAAAALGALGGEAARGLLEGALGAEGDGGVRCEIEAALAVA